MNPFEKIFNYQILSRLDESGAFALTSQERVWLKSMLELDAAGHAFTPETLDKLNALLQNEAPFHLRRIIVEKGRNKDRHVYHPLLRQLRRYIIQGQGMKLTTKLKHGGQKADQTGIPYKLEYSMVKREWYLLWYGTRQHNLMSTKLRNIVELHPWELPAERTTTARARLLQLLEARKRTALVEVNPLYNAELSRILSAFSCFDKNVSYEEETDTYRIHIQHLADESEFLLSKIRFLGLRVKVIDQGYMRRRMLEASTKALMRYEASEPLP
ncbi:WYL domain-containing protein [Paenibacillus sp. 1011MAR3C5]|uniref:WYL domain-containing protein n=1 Tax=Paenibacillus sp. 1011MAR3C5 TaxID=1675787 RepID=UPI000E6D1590|nr:WYL domain-containing protein [Paenibacillus sp. 1011MAR3C5]RJE84381.1 WYL domain-containing protein [Paenibacillus sp. 1011MAR3C5]